MPSENVSDALIGYQESHEVRVRQEQTVGDLAESVRLSIMRYRGGTTTYLEVLDGQRSLFDAELTLAQARGTSKEVGRIMLEFTLPDADSDNYNIMTPKMLTHTDSANSRY
jgi:hypothetical protein